MLRGSIFIIRWSEVYTYINLFKVIISFLSGGLFPKLIGESIQNKALLLLQWTIRHRLFVSLVQDVFALLIIKDL